MKFFLQDDKIWFWRNNVWDACGRKCDLNKRTEWWQQDCEESGAVQEPVARTYGFRKQDCMYCSLCFMEN